MPEMTDDEILELLHTMGITFPAESGLRPGELRYWVRRTLEGSEVRLRHEETGITAAYSDAYFVQANFDRALDLVLSQLHREAEDDEPFVVDEFTIIDSTDFVMGSTQTIDGITYWIRHEPTGQIVHTTLADLISVSPSGSGPLTVNMIFNTLVPILRERIQDGASEEAEPGATDITDSL